MKKDIKKLGGAKNSMPNKVTHKKDDLMLNLDVFLLGAGRPSSGDIPSALKFVALDTKAIDWQIYSFKAISNSNTIHFIGGYRVDSVINDYPQLSYTVVPGWEKKGVLHTLFKAPFSNRSLILSYSDTLFRKEALLGMLSIDADIVFGVDSGWRERYESRSESDIQLAETVEIENLEGKLSIVEFTGLIYFRSKVVNLLSQLDENDVGESLLDLINYLKAMGLSVKPFDVAGQWSELNSPNDVARFVLGTKAETLDRLKPLVNKSYIGKQVRFTSARWHNEPDLILNEISKVFSGTDLVVRSSSISEDSWGSSNAGEFKSLLNIDSRDRLKVQQSIDEVIASYGQRFNDKDQVLVQEFLKNIRFSGVVFTCALETGAPYYRFNFDDKTQSTESVTSGASGDLRTILVSRLYPKSLQQVEPKILPVLNAVQEIEKLLLFDKLDVEFAIDVHGVVHIFQVRPITVDHSKFEVDTSVINKSIKNNSLHFQAQQNATPFIFGESAVFANMPDWNPAEIIGTRPKPLAFSLYRYLITNDVWAQQRFEFGYRDIRSFPLILSFSGQPYVDVRASLNSFIPAKLSDDIAKRLANAYVSILSDNPQYHDKIEFDVAFTVWTPEFLKHVYSRLGQYDVTSDDIFHLESALKDITRNALKSLKKPLNSIFQLKKRRQSIELSSASIQDKILLLLDDCKRFGTLAFAHAARSGFVATTLLKGFVDAGILTEERKLEFMRSITTVASEFEKDKWQYSLGSLSLEDLVRLYGHLRPGTYDIENQAYWENPERYFVMENTEVLLSALKFELSKVESENIKKFLIELGGSQTPEWMIDYLQQAIQMRESVKFEFTKNLSKALDLCLQLAERLSLTRDEISFLEYNDLKNFKLNIVDPAELKEIVYYNQKKYKVSQLVELPGIINKEIDFYCFERHFLQPNFITLNKICANVELLNNNNLKALTGSIVLIPQSDPGYDWLFGYKISGLITKFGGANSHMAIRAAEADLPAAIGVGEKFYEQIAKMNLIELDCCNQVIREVL